MSRSQPTESSRYQQPMNLQDKAAWMVDGEMKERLFVERYGNELGLHLNPAKVSDPAAPDLIRLVDLKTVDTPFRNYPGCISLNAKDMLRYWKVYGNISVVFDVEWDAPGRGVWSTMSLKLFERRLRFPLHFYQQRPAEEETDEEIIRWLCVMEPERLRTSSGGYRRIIDTDGNATCSYVIPLAAPLVCVRHNISRFGLPVK